MYLNFRPFCCAPCFTLNLVSPCLWWIHLNCTLHNFLSHSFLSLSFWNSHGWGFFFFFLTLFLFSAKYPGSLLCYSFDLFWHPLAFSFWYFPVYFCDWLLHKILVFFIQEAYISTFVQFVCMCTSTCICLEAWGQVQLKCGILLFM